MNHKNHINHRSDVHPTFTDVYFDDVKMTYVPTAILQYNEYYPFGLQTSTSWTRENSKNNFLGNGGSEMNATSGLYDTYYRGYDPALGRFLQVDPLATSTNSMTPYHYAGNNPVMFNDPNGDRAYVSMEDLLNPPIPGQGSGGPPIGGNPVMNWMLSLSGSSGSSYGKNGITNQGGYIYANSFNGMADENISNTTISGIAFTYGVSTSVLSGTGYKTGYIDQKTGEYHSGERTYDDSKIVFAGASQGSNWQSSPQDPLQDSHGLPVYTMDQFLAANKGKSYFSIINQSAVRNGLPGGPKMRMVRNPRDGNIMDMRHVMVVGFGFGEEIGYLFEYTQEVRGMGQAFNGQDLYSNAIGDDFVKEYLMIGGYVKDWSTTFYNYMNRGSK